MENHLYYITVNICYIKDSHKYTTHSLKSLEINMQRIIQFSQKGIQILNVIA